MSDWEDELEKEEKGEKKEEEKEKDAEESEEIIKKKVDYKPPAKEAKDKVDYEKKYYEKNKDLIESKKEIEKAVAGIKDEELKVKKALELQRIKQAEKFLGKDIQESNLPLSLEKDFIDLAKKNAVKINDAKKPQAFTFSYLKNSLELLAPTLDSDKISDLNKLLTVTFNKKLKEENAGGKSKSKKPNINAGKAAIRSEKRGIIEDLGGRDDYEEEEYDDDDFM